MDIYSICVVGYTRCTVGPCLNKDFFLGFSEVIDAELERTHQKHMTVCMFAFILIKLNMQSHTPTHTQCREHAFVFVRNMCKPFRLTGQHDRAHVRGS